MRLIFLYGLPATGKLTVAQHLAALTGYRLFHNHLAVDLLLSTFDFGTAPFIALREEIWLSVFREASRAQLPGLIFTFNPETTVRPHFIQQAIDTVTEHGGDTTFIELTCPLEHLKQRIDMPSRHHYRKLTSLPFFEQLHASGEFDTSHMPPPTLTLDTSIHTPTEAATQIAATLNLPSAHPPPAPTPNARLFHASPRNPPYPPHPSSRARPNDAARPANRHPPGRPKGLPRPLGH